MKRHSCEYDFAGRVSDADAEGLRNAVRECAVDAEAWIKAPTNGFSLWLAVGPCDGATATTRLTE
jgi:hypothetical protein